jgi:hypothetical protein
MFGTRNLCLAGSVLFVLGLGLAAWVLPADSATVPAATATDTKAAAEQPAAPAVTGPLSSTAPIDVRLYGAKGDGTTDDTAAFQAAIEAARATSLKVYAPRARYLFTGRLNVPAGITLEGSFDSVTSHPGGGRGGRAGQPDGTMFLVTGDVGKEDAPAFITLNGNSTLRGVAILYPEQTTTDTPRAYPYSVAMRGNNPAVLDVELINSYDGIDASRNQRHLIRNVGGQPLHIGVFVDGIMDIGRMENVHFNPWWGGGDAEREVAWLAAELGFSDAPSNGPIPGRPVTSPIDRQRGPRLTTGHTVKCLILVESAERSYYIQEHFHPINGSAKEG